MKPISLSRLALFPLVAIVISLSSHSFGDSAAWNGSVDAHWHDVNNWEGPPAAVPGASDTATFSGAGSGQTTVDLGLGVTLKTLLFDTADAAAYTLGAGAAGEQSLALSSGGSVTVNAAVANDQTVAATLALGGAASFTVNAASNSLTLAAPVTGTGSLTKLGVGYLYLDQDSTFSGGVTLGNGTTANTSTSGVATANSGGYVVLGHNNALGTGSVTAKGAQLWAGVPGLVIPNTFLTANSSIRFGGTNDLTLAGSFSLDASRDFGNYSLTATLTMAGPFNLGSYSASFKAIDGAVANGTTLITGTVSGSGGLTVDVSYDNGRVMLAGDNTYTGNTAVNGGMLSVLHTNATGTTGSLTLGNTDAKLELGDGIVFTRELTVSNTGNNKVLRAALGATAEYAGAVTVNETVGGNFDLTSDAGSTLTLSGGIVSTNGAGVTKLGEGTVILTGSNTVTDTFVLGNGTSNLSGTDTATASSGGFLVICHSNAFGLATLDFKGTQIRAGVPGLVIDNPLLIDQGAIRFSGTNDLELTGDASLVNGSNRGFGNYSGRSQLTFRGALTTTNGWALQPQANNDATTNGTTRFLGPVIGGGKFEVDGNYDNGLVVLGGANSFTGTTTVSAGTLRLDYSEQDNSKLADAASLTLANATLELVGGTHLEQVASTAVSGNVLVTRGSGAATLALGDLAVSGALRLSGDDVASTTSPNVNGLLPGVFVAAPGVTLWAANSGVSDGGSGYLIRTSDGSPSGVDRLGGVVPDDVTLNVRIANGGVSGNVTLADASNEVNAVTMDASDGPATLDMSGAVFNAGSGILQAGTSGGLTVGTAAGEGVLTAGGADMGSPATLVLANDSAANPLVILSSIQNNGSATVGLTKSGSGTVILSATNTYSGGTCISAGTLQLDNGGNAAQLGAGTIRNDGQLAFARGTGAGDLTLGNAIHGSGSVAQNGAAGTRVILQGTTSSFSGGSTISGNILRGEDTNGDTQFLQLGTGPVTLNGGTLELRSNGGADDVTIITGDGVTGNSVVMTASSTLDVARYNGTTRVRDTFHLGGLMIGNQSLSFAAANKYRAAFAGAVTLSGNATFSPNANDTLSWLALNGPVGEDGTPRSVYKTGIGSLVLAGDNTYSGGTTLGNLTANTAGPASTTATANSGGFVLLAHNNALGTGLVLERGCQIQALVPGLEIPNDVVITNGGFRFGGTNALAFSGTFTLISAARDIANYTGNQRLTLNNIELNGQNATFVGTAGAAANGDTCVLGCISNSKGTGGVYAKTAFVNGRLILAGANTYATGTFIESQGTLQLGDGGTTGSLNPSSDISNSGTLIFNHSDTLTQGVDFDGVLSGTGTVAAAGSGIVVLTGANTYTGPTVINPGATLQLGNGGTAGSLSLASPILADGTLAVNRSDTVTQGTHFDAVVDGAGGVLQAGSGTLVLTGANTYTGLTAVTSGTLLVNGGQSLATGPATVAAGAVLGGTGVCGSAGTVAAGGILSPGTAGVGTLTLGSLTLQQGAVYRWDVASAANDTVDVTGDLMLPDGFTLNVNRLEPGALRQKVLFTYGGSYIGPEAAEVTTTGGATTPYRTLHDAANTRILLEAIQTGTLITVQ